jgi:hypothetical protein
MQCWVFEKSRVEADDQPLDDHRHEQVQTPDQMTELIGHVPVEKLTLSWLLGKTD